MAVIMVVKSLNEWLDEKGFRRRDLLVDRAGESEPDFRYMLTRSLGGSDAVTSGQIFNAYNQGHLEFVEQFDVRTLSLPSSSDPAFRLLRASGMPSQPGQSPRRWPRR